MKHEFQFTFDVPFIKAALRRDLLWKGYVLGGIMVALALVMHLLYGTVYIWFTATLLFMAGFVIWRFHAMLTKISRRVFDLWTRQSPSGLIHYELDEEGFSVVLDQSRSRYHWEGLRRLWRYDDVWLIEIVKMQSTFFPTDQAPDKVREYIVERCRSAGVRV